MYMALARLELNESESLQYGVFTQNFQYGIDRGCLRGAGNGYAQRNGELRHF